jgi:hypothetical protein
MKSLLLALTAVSVALVPAAAASTNHTPSPSLALVPLPKSAIGSSVQGFTLAHNSGVVSNETAASSTPDGTAATFKKLGRLSGYVLEYGNAFTGAPGITDVHTGIDQYKTAADAKRGLAFLKKEDSKLGALDNPSFTVTNVPVQVPAVGQRHFAYLTSYSASNIAPVSGLREQVLEGRYVLDIIVTAGSASFAEALAPKLAKKLDTRLRLALRGRLHAKPVKLPAPQKAGPPSGGPDLSKLALLASDLVGKASVDKAYVVDPAAISDYSVFMLPAGQFDALDQEIEWYPSANEASFFADFENAAALAQPGTTALDLSALGHGAQGSVTASPSFSGGQVFFSSGNLAEFVFMAAEGAIKSSDVMSVAQAAAGRIDAAGLGTG